MSQQLNNKPRLSSTSTRPLVISLVIITVIMIAEVVGGLTSRSLALLGDAGHMLVDALALGLSLFAVILARRPADSNKTFGYHRAEIMTALINGIILVLVSIYIFYEAYQRFLEPVAINTPIMLIVALIGLGANIAVITLLRRNRHHSLNIKAALWHVIGDTISSVGVITGSIIILLTGWAMIDAIIAVIIGIIILWGATRIIREATDILLESVPAHIKVNMVRKAMRNVVGIKDIHDIHIWTINYGIYAMSAHLEIEDQMVSQSTDVVSTINQNIAEQFGINHTTFQLECDSCSSNGHCSLHQESISVTR